MMNEAGRIWTEEQETPAPKSGQLLIEVHASMVSPGSELGGVKRRRENPGSETRQRPFGYTNAGVVIGKEGDCDEFEIGDRVSGMGGGYALHATHASTQKGSQHRSTRWGNNAVSHTTYVQRSRITSVPKKQRLIILRQPHFTPCNAGASVSARTLLSLDWASLDNLHAR